MFAGLHRERREGGVVEPVVDLEAVLHHQRVGTEGRVVDGVELGLHPAAGAHQRGEAVFVDDAREGIVGVVGAGDVAEGEVLAGVNGRHDDERTALDETGAAHLGAADPGRAAIVRRAEVAPRAQDRCRPDLVGISAGRAAAEEFHTPKVVVDGLGTNKVGAKVSVGGALDIAPRERPDASRGGRRTAARRQSHLEPAGDCQLAVEVERRRVRDHEPAAAESAAVKADDATLADVGGSVGHHRDRLGRIAGIRIAEVAVAGGVGRRLDALVGEVPDADIVGPHLLGAVAGRVSALAESPVHADGGAVGENADTHPDERLAGDVPGIDFVGELGVGGRIHEHHVLAGASGAAVVEAAQAAFADAHEEREVGERLGTAVALDAQVDVVAEDAVGVAPDGELGGELGCGPVGGLGDGGADEVDTDVGGLVLGPRAGLGGRVVDLRLAVALPVGVDGDAVLDRHLLGLPARQLEDGDRVRRLGDGPVESQGVGIAGGPAVVGRVIEDEGGLIRLGVPAAALSAALVIEALVGGMHDTVLHAAVVDEVGDDGWRGDGRLADAPLEHARRNRWGCGIPDVVVAVERKPDRVDADVDRVGDTAVDTAVAGPAGGGDDDEVAVGVVDKVGGGAEGDGLDRQTGDRPLNLDLGLSDLTAFPQVVRGVLERGHGDVAAGIGGVGNAAESVQVFAAVGFDADKVAAIVDEAGLRGRPGDGLAADAPGNFDGVAGCRRVTGRPFAVAVVGGADGGGGGVGAGVSGGIAVKVIKSGIGRILNAVLGVAGVVKAGNRSRANEDTLGDGEVELYGIGGAIRPSAVGGAGGIVERRGNGVSSNGGLLLVAQGVVARVRGHGADLDFAVVDVVGGKRHFGIGNYRWNNFPTKVALVLRSIVLPPETGFGTNRKIVHIRIDRAVLAARHNPVAAGVVRVNGGKLIAGIRLFRDDLRRDRRHQEPDDDNATAAGRAGRIATTAAAAAASRGLAWRCGGSIVRPNPAVATTTLATGMRRSALRPTATAAAGVVFKFASDVALQTVATTAAGCIAANRTGTAATRSLSNIVAAAAIIALPRCARATRMRGDVSLRRAATTRTAAPAIALSATAAAAERAGDFRGSCGVGDRRAAAIAARLGDSLVSSGCAAGTDVDRICLRRQGGVSGNKAAGAAATTLAFIRVSDFYGSAGAAAADNKVAGGPGLGQGQGADGGGVGVGEDEVGAGGIGTGIGNGCARVGDGYARPLDSVAARGGGEAGEECDEAKRGEGWQPPRKGI